MELSGAGEGHAHASGRLRECTRTHRHTCVNACTCHDIQKPANPGHFLRPLLAQGSLRLPKGHGPLYSLPGEVGR